MPSDVRKIDCRIGAQPTTLRVVVSILATAASLRCRLVDGLLPATSHRPGNPEAGDVGLDVK